MPAPAPRMPTVNTRLRFVVTLVSVVLLTISSHAARVYAQAAGPQGPELANVRAVADRGIPPDQALRRSGFPQEHAYQRELLRYLRTLTEADLAIDVEPSSCAPSSRTPSI